MSRAKAQANRDAHAKSPNVAKMRVEIRALTIAVVAPLDPVAVRKTWMIAYLVGLLRASVMSPMPNKIAIEKAMVSTPLMASAITMLRGTTSAESLTSSPVRISSADVSRREQY